MKTGLTDDEVIISRNEHGTNEILAGKKDSFIKHLLSTLGDPIIKILLIALAVKTLFLFKDFDWYETLYLRFRNMEVKKPLRNYKKMLLKLKVVCVEIISYLKLKLMILL